MRGVFLGGCSIFIGNSNDAGICFPYESSKFFTGGQYQIRDSNIILGEENKYTKYISSSSDMNSTKNVHDDEEMSNDEEIFGGYQGDFIDIDTVEIFGGYHDGDFIDIDTDEIFGGNAEKFNELFGGFAAEENKKDVILGGASRKSGGEDDEKVKKLFGNQNECHFALDKTEVCAPQDMQQAIKKAAEELTEKKVKNTRQAIEVLKDKLDCDTETCVIKSLADNYDKYLSKDKVQDALLKYYKPVGPANDFGLLSNFNIDDVLSQYAQKYKNFLHVKFQMRDFEERGTDLSRLDLAKKIAEGFKTFGVVLNTDYSTGRGIHWFCIFGDFREKDIKLEYFNSSGREPLPEVQKWLKNTEHRLRRDTKRNVEVIYTANRPLQDDNHSCGVWCLAYIWLRLEDVPTSWFSPKNINDSIMHKLRSYLFIAE